MEATTDNVLRLPAFRRLLVARVAATMATQTQAVVVGWQLYGLTGDPMTLGWVGLAQFLPMLVFILPAGDLADRIDRRRLLSVSWTIQAAAGALFLLLTLNATTSVLPFYAVLVLFGTARALAAPALPSLVPLVVGEHLLSRAVAWHSSFFQMAIVVGPALGGLIYLLGPAAGYLLAALLFAVAGVAIAGLPLARAQQASRETGSAVQRFLAGVAYVRSRPMILGALSMDLFAVLLGGATALLPVYAAEILHVGPVGLGMLRSAIALGAFVTGIWLGRRPLTRRAGPAMFGGVALFGAAMIVFGLSTHFWLSFAALALAGAADMVSVFVRATLIQIATPDAMRGRVSAVSSLFISGSNELGEFESGAVAAWLGAVPAVVVGGVGTLAIVGIWRRAFPALWRIDRLEDCRVP